MPERQYLPGQAPTSLAVVNNTDYSARMKRHGRTPAQTAASNRAGALAKRKANGIDTPEEMQKATNASNRAGALAKRKANGITTPEKMAAATLASNIAGQKAKNLAKKVGNKGPGV